MTTAHAFDREEMMAYLDGQLADEPRQSAAKAHLETCEACRGLAESLEGVSTRLGEWQVEPAPANVKLPAVQPVEPSSDVRSERASLDGVMAWLRWPRVGIAAAAVGLVLVAGVVSVHRMERVEDVYQPGSTVSFGQPQGRSREIAPAPAAPAPAERRETLADRAVGVADPNAIQLREQVLPTAPMVVRTAAIVLSTDQFDNMRASVERLTSAHDGRIGSLSVSGESQRRALSATVRVPSARLDALLGQLRTLGRVQSESVSTQDVTSEYVDLGVRVSNAKREEQRLLELLRDRTGKLSDVLAVEQEIARVRTEIERMEASMKITKDRVDLSTINLRIDENYRAEVALGPLSLGARLRNAVIDGSRAAAASVFAVLVGVIQILPTVAVWALVLAWPVRWAARRMRHASR